MQSSPFSQFMKLRHLTHTHTHARTHARTRARAHARTHARTHTHTHTLPFGFIYVPDDDTPLQAYIWTGSIITVKTIFLHTWAATQVGNTPKFCFGAFIYIRTLCMRAVKPQVSLCCAYMREVPNVMNLMNVHALSHFYTCMLSYLVGK